MQYHVLRLIRRRSVGRVDTVTVGGVAAAEFELVWIARVPTAISCIISTGAVVISFITNTVASPIRVTAFPDAFLLFWFVFTAIGIQTLAFCAKLLLIRILGIAAAITFIPSTTAVVVFIVTDSVTSPIRLSALCVADLFLGIQAGALAAKFKVALCITAVATIPVACAVVIFIVAVGVAFPFGCKTFTICFRAVFDFGITIFALALRAIFAFVNFGGATAIALVPVATGIIVDIIANSVTDVCVPTFALDQIAGALV